MAIVKKWTEVEDECLGPDKTNTHWVMYLFIHLCVEYSRKTKRGLQKFIRRHKTIKSIEKRERARDECNAQKARAIEPQPTTMA